MIQALEHRITSSIASKKDIPKVSRVFHLRGGMEND